MSAENISCIIQLQVVLMQRFVTVWQDIIKQGQLAVGVITIVKVAV